MFKYVNADVQDSISKEQSRIFTEIIEGTVASSYIFDIRD